MQRAAKWYHVWGQREQSNGITMYMDRETSQMVLLCIWTDRESNQTVILCIWTEREQSNGTTVYMCIIIIVIIIIIITYLFECCGLFLTAFLADWDPQNEALGSMRRQLGPYPQVL
jgi:hypothetical protein